MLVVRSAVVRTAATAGLLRLAPAVPARISMRHLQSQQPQQRSSAFMHTTSLSLTKLGGRLYPALPKPQSVSSSRAQWLSPSRRPQLGHSTARSISSTPISPLPPKASQFPTPGFGTSNETLATSCNSSHVSASKTPKLFSLSGLRGVIAKGVGRFLPLSSVPVRETLTTKSASVQESLWSTLRGAFRKPSQASSSQTSRKPVASSTAPVGVTDTADSHQKGSPEGEHGSSRPPPGLTDQIDLWPLFWTLCFCVVAHELTGDEPPQKKFLNATSKRLTELQDRTRTLEDYSPAIEWGTSREPMVALLVSIHRELLIVRGCLSPLPPVDEMFLSSVHPSLLAWSKWARTDPCRHREARADLMSTIAELLRLESIHLRRDGQVEGADQLQRLSLVHFVDAGWLYGTSHLAPTENTKPNECIQYAAAQVKAFRCAIRSGDRHLMGVMLSGFNDADTLLMEALEHPASVAATSPQWQRLRIERRATHAEHLQRLGQYKQAAEMWYSAATIFVNDKFYPSRVQLGHLDMHPAEYAVQATHCSLQADQPVEAWCHTTWARYLQNNVECDAGSSGSAHQRHFAEAHGKHIARDLEVVMQELFTRSVKTADQLQAEQNRIEEKRQEERAIPKWTEAQVLVVHGDCTKQLASLASLKLPPQRPHHFLAARPRPRALPLLGRKSPAPTTSLFTLNRPWRA